MLPCTEIQKATGNYVPVHSDPVLRRKNFLVSKYKCNLNFHTEGMSCFLGLLKAILCNVTETEGEFKVRNATCTNKSANYSKNLKCGFNNINNNNNNNNNLEPPFFLFGRAH